MEKSDPVVISGAVEGDLDERILRRLIEHVGAKVGTIYGRAGKQFIRDRLDGYNRAARRSPWAVLVDLDHDDDCAPPLRASWLPKPASKMCFRVAVREVEAWLLADRGRFSAFFGVAASRIPVNPEAEPEPKRTVVELARRARRKDIREDMVPRPGSGCTGGPAYTSRMIEFVMDTSKGWRPEVAAKSSDSLNRCLRCLRRLVKAS